LSLQHMVKINREIVWSHRCKTLLHALQIRPAVPISRRDIEGYSAD
jgi:hypothetical protein